MRSWKIQNEQNTEVEAKISFLEQNSECAVFTAAKIKRREPYFGLQTYFDKREGISFVIHGIEAEKWMVIYQHKDWWCRPVFIDKEREIPERTQMILLKNGGEYCVFLAVSNEMCRTDFSGSTNAIRVKISSNCENLNAMEGLSFVWVSGNDPYKICKRAVEYALLLLKRPDMLRQNRKYPEIFEYFGWCSWDAFYHEVSEEGVLEKAKELKKKNIPVKWFLIDDGWLDADYTEQVLCGLDAEKGKFPEGLAGCVKKLKVDYRISKVGVWHAIMGYWNGLKSESTAAKLLGVGARRLPDSRIIPDADAGKAFCFFDKWHSYLQECGIDFVKVDGQSSVSLFYSGLKSYGEASAAIQKGLGASAALHFNNQIINCMGMASEDMWNRTSSVISRSSDDFVPNVPHGFCEHAIQNSYNSLLQGQFYWGDWDMFWSEHEENRQSSMLRAVSGGPVYTSDPVDKTDGRYIWPLIFKDGKIIRCDEVGLPAIDCLFENPAESKHALKVFNRKKDCVIVAAFAVNQQEDTAVVKISTKDIPDLKEKECIVYSWNTQKLRVLNANAEIIDVIQKNDADIYSVIPMKNNCRVLGLLDKYVGIAAVEWEERNGKIQYSILREGGQIGIWSTEKILKILCDKQEIPFEKKDELYVLNYEKNKEVLVEIYFEP